MKTTSSGIHIDNIIMFYLILFKKNENTPEIIGQKEHTRITWLNEI